MSWYIIMTYQSRNNENDPLTQPWDELHEYDYVWYRTLGGLIPYSLGVLINNNCYGKFQMRLIRDFLFVD